MHRTPKSAVSFCLISYLLTAQAEFDINSLIKVTKVNASKMHRILPGHG